MSKFDLTKYLGTWYELIHYPSFFQRNDNYNTKAEYMLMPDNTIKVHNTTVVQGQIFDSYGIGRQLDTKKFRVDFDQKEINNLTDSSQFRIQQQSDFIDVSLANYVIDDVWISCHGCYRYAVVTDDNKQTLYVLSRTPNPPLEEYNIIMQYVVANYDRDRLVQTPHFR